MLRTTGDGFVPNLHGAGKNGFTDGSPGVSAATLVNAAWFNPVQEELCGLIEKAGLVLDPNRVDQLYAAARLLAIETGVINQTPRTAANSFALGFRAMVPVVDGYLAVGDQGEIQTSSDAGATWAHRAAAGGFAGGFLSCTYGASLFVAAGASGEIQTSAAGVTYTHQTAAGSYAGIFYGAATNGTTLVLVGTNGEIQTSTNGSTWTKRTPAGGYTGDFYAATYGNGRFVIMGASSIQWSTDGITWNLAATQIAVIAGTYGAGVFVAVGVAGRIYSSPDGSTWTQRTPGSGYASAFAAVTFGAGLFFALGASGEIQASPNGFDWRSYRRSGMSVAMNAAAVAGGTSPGASTLCLMGPSASIRTTMVL